MIKHKVLSFLMQLLSGLGFIFILSPFILYWFIHGSRDRYLWIINGPSPFSSFGGGPFQAFIYTCLFLLGLILTSISWSLYNKS